MIDRLDWFVTRATEVIVAGLMIVILLLVPTETVFRYAFGRSLYIVNELSTFLLVWIGLIGCSLAIRYGGHAAFQLLQGRLARLLGINPVWLAIACQALTFVFALALLITGVTVAQDKLNVYNPTLGISMFWVFLAVPVGATMMIFQAAMLVRAGIRNMSRTAAPDASSAP